MSLQIENHGLVSIVIPVYNAEKWLGYCLNSVMAQTYPWFEAILVNDGSSDTSLQICEAYAAIDARFHAISVENGGVSRARNLGIAHTKGKYLTFLDSDDAMTADALERMVNAAISSHHQLVVGNMLMVDFSSPDKPRTLLSSSWAGERERTYDADAFQKNRMRLIYHTSLLEGPCAKLYDLTLWKQLHLQFPPDLSLGEDFVTNLQYYANCNGITFLNKTIYYYNNESQSASLTHRYRPDLFDIKMHLMDVLLKHLGGEETLCNEEKVCFYNYVTHTGLKCIKEAALNSQLTSDSSRISEIQKILSDPLFAHCCQQATWMPDEFQRARGLLVLGHEKDLLRYMRHVREKPPRRNTVLCKTKIKHGLQSLLFPLQRLFRFSNRLQTEELTNQFRAQAEALTALSNERTEELTNIGRRIQDNIADIALTDKQILNAVHNLEVASWQQTQRFVQLQISELRQKKKALMLGTAEHQNIGDAAITLAEQYVLQQQFPEYYQVEFSTYEFEHKFSFLEAIVNPQDIIFINGGGNLGSLYLEEEKIHRRIIQTFPCNPIVILPQSISFTDDENGRLQLALSEQVYNRHKNLTIYTRGNDSFAFSREHFPNARTYLMPDMVLALHRDYGFEREGILLNLREDSESLFAEAKEKILMHLQGLHEPIKQRSNIAPEDISRISRASIVNAELMYYAGCKVVVTDRLHGMLFAIATNTPCVVLESSTGKSGDAYRTFFQDSNAVAYLGGDLEQLPQAVSKAITMESPQYPILTKLNYENLRSNFGVLKPSK